VDGGDDRSELKVITMFLFRTREKVLRPVDADNPEARWVERSKVAPLLTHEMDKRFFLGARSSARVWAFLSFGFSASYVR